MKSKSMKHKRARRPGIDHSARRMARAKRVASGTWMGRNVTHRSRTDYNRQREKLETRRMARDEKE